MRTAGKSRVKVLHVALVAGLLFAIGTAAPTVVAGKRVATTPPCLSSSGSWVNSGLPQAQTGAFRVEFDATPSSAGIDGVVGLSSGPASAYTSLAAIVRFNPAGTIDARNGVAYTAATAVAYTAGTTYHFILDVNLTAHTYNASVVVNGAPVVIGTTLAFRTEQAGVSSLNNLASMTSPGSQTICNIAVTSPSSGCLSSSGSWVNSSLPQAQTGAFRVEFDATPSSTGIDGVVGLSSGPASAYTSLAAIVRFNPAGTIDAINGAAYTAATAVTYTAGTTYHFILDVNVTAHTYNASVVVNGAPVVIGTTLAFRTQQAGVSSLNNLASMTSPGSQTICNIAVTSPSSGCLSSSGSWVNSSLPQAQTGAFRVEFDATPSSTGIDGVVGLSSGPASAYTSLAAIVRFNPAGTIDARNGAAYTAATAVAYTAGTTYHFILDVNLTAHTYNASVVVNGAPVVIGTTLAFRTEQAGVSSLNNLASMTSPGSQTICNVAVSAAAPSITTQPVSQTVTSGQTATFSASATGPALLSYQWQKNGAAIAGATSSTYQTPVTTVSDTQSQFNVVVSDNTGSVTSSGATLTVNPPAVAPSITTQPLSQTVTSGQTATFSAAATGTAPMSYQWQKNGAAIVGATSSTYQTPVTTASDSQSQFTVAVSNSAGSVTSSGVILTVKPPAVVPSITTQPLSQTVTAGQTATFSVAGTGTAPVSYQWQKNESPIGGATSATYETPATAVSDNQSQFTVVMSNSAGDVTSSPATLTVISPGCVPSSGSWVNSALPQAETGMFRVQFDATPSSTGIDGVVGLSLGPAGAYTSLAAIVRFNPAGTIDARNGAAYTAATTVTYTAGTTYHFILDVNLTAQTYNASVVVNGAGAPVVIGTALAFRTEQAGVSSLNSLASMTSPGSQSICNVTASAVPPSITTQPVSQTITPGQTATFSVAGTGTAPMSYRWQKNGAAISGATSSTYQTPAETLSDNGSQFSVVVTNPAGSVNSGSATLAVSAGTVLLGASSTQLSFGSVNVSSDGVQSVTITNSGNSNVTISNVTVSGAGFNAGGGIAGLTLSPGQTAPLSVTFAPAATGSASGSVTVTSNATNSPITVALTGTGATQAHSVSLSWTASTSSVIGYNVYSSRVSGGPYVKLNPTPMAATAYTDSTVQSGQTYYYVTTAVGSTSSGSESGFSSQASAVIP